MEDIQIIDKKPEVTIIIDGALLKKTDYTESNGSIILNKDIVDCMKKENYTISLQRLHTAKR